MRHAAAELCLLVSQGAHDRIRQALHLAADNCTLARFPKAVESSRCGWRRIKWERARGRHDRIGQAALVCVSAGVPWSIGGNERARCCYHCCCYYCWVCQSVLGVLYCTVLVWRRLLLLLLRLRVVVPWASQFSTS